jgi:hypothetical protein
VPCTSTLPDVKYTLLGNRGSSIIRMVKAAEIPINSAGTVSCLILYASAGETIIVAMLGMFSFFVVLPYVVRHTAGGTVRRVPPQTQPLRSDHGQRVQP